MPKQRPYPLSDIKAAIETAAGKLFSSGTLANISRAALALSKMPGLNLFATAVPWRIVLPQGNPIAGFSETLCLAAKDIHSQLWVFAKSLPPDTIVSLTIDATQLPKPRSSVQLQMTEGGQ